MMLKIFRELLERVALLSLLYPHSLERQIKVYHKDVKLGKNGVSGGKNQHKVHIKRMLVTLFLLLQAFR